MWLVARCFDNQIIALDCFKTLNEAFDYAEEFGEVSRDRFKPLVSSHNETVEYYFFENESSIRIAYRSA